MQVASPHRTKHHAKKGHPMARSKAAQTLGDALHAERIRRGDSTRPLSQGVCAQELGCSQPVFSEWERDAAEPGGEYYKALAGWLHVSQEQLFVLIGWAKINRAEAELAETERRLGRRRGMK